MPNRQKQYGMRSNIPSLTEQALLSVVYDVLEPTRMPTYSRQREGGIFSRNIFDEFDEEKLQQFAFTSDTYFPALEGYVNVPNLNNAPFGEDGAGDPITFTLNKVFQDDLSAPTEDRDFSHLVIDNVLITGYESAAVPRGNDPQTHRLTGLVTAWRKFWGQQIIGRYSKQAQILESYIPNADGTSWTLVDHMKPIRDALNASIA